MAVSLAGSGFGSCSGRALSVRRGDAVPDLLNAPCEAGRDGATILVADPDCWSGPEPTMALAARRGFQVIISAGFNDIVYDKLIMTSIFIIDLTPEALATVQDAVDSDPGILLSVDAGRGEVRARGRPLARFEPAHEADNETDSRGHGSEVLARRLLMAQRQLGSAGLPGEVRMRLQRRLVAICDAMKAPGADAVRCARRLDRFFTELARTGRVGPGLAQDGRVPARRRRGGVLAHHGPPSRPLIPLSRSISSSSGVDTP
jgi:hypothetical protein